MFYLFNKEKPLDFLVGNYGRMNGCEWSVRSHDEGRGGGTTMLGRMGLLAAPLLL